MPPAKPVEHSTRNGYRRGCRIDENCPAFQAGKPSCRQANNQYQADLREIRNLSRNRPARSGNKSSTSGLRITVGNARPDNKQDQDFPVPDVSYVDPPKTLLDAQVTPDPPPADQPDSQYGYPEDVPFVLTPGLKADAKGKLALFGTLVATPLDMVDPYCGAALSQNLDNMIDKAMPLIMRSPAAIKFLTSTSGGLMEWLAFLQACWPVITAAYAHHLARSVIRGSDGNYYRRQGETTVATDPNMPPVPDSYDYSAA